MLHATCCTAKSLAPWPDEVFVDNPPWIGNLIWLSQRPATLLWIGAIYSISISGTIYHIYWKPTQNLRSALRTALWPILMNKMMAKFLPVVLINSQARTECLSLVLLKASLFTSQNWTDGEDSWPNRWTDKHIRQQTTTTATRRKPKTTVADTGLHKTTTSTTTRIKTRRKPKTAVAINTGPQKTTTSTTTTTTTTSKLKTAIADTGVDHKKAGPSHGSAHRSLSKLLIRKHKKCTPQKSVVVNALVALPLIPCLVKRKYYANEYDKSRIL